MGWGNEHRKEIRTHGRMKGKKDQPETSGNVNIKV